MTVLTFVVVGQITGVPSAINGNFRDVPVGRDIMNCGKNREKYDEEELHRRCVQINLKSEL